MIFNPFSKRFNSLTSTEWKHLQGLGFGASILNPAEVILENPHQLLKRMSRKETMPSRLRELLADATEATAVESVRTFLRTLREGSQQTSPLTMPPPMTVPPEELSEEQRRVVSDAVDGRQSMFITGAPGSGKTSVLQAIATAGLKKGLRVALTATTGIAAMHLGGTTLHHAFKIHHGTNKFSQARSLRTLDILVIDEVSMLSRTLFEALDRHARRARGENTPFGGLQIILSGDFLQLCAVEDTSPIFRHPLFGLTFHRVVLKKNFRQYEEHAFQEALQTMRYGDIHPSFATLVRHVKDMSEVKDVENMLCLFPKRFDAEQHNRMCLNKLAGPTTTLTNFCGPVTLSGSWTKVVHILFAQATDAERVRVQLLMHLSAMHQTFSPDRLCCYNVSSLCVAARVLQLPHTEVEERQSTQQTLHDAVKRYAQKRACHVSWTDKVSSTTGVERLLHKEESSQGQLEELSLKEGCRVLLNRNFSPTLVNGLTGVVIGFVGIAGAAASLNQSHFLCWKSVNHALQLLPKNSLVPTVRFSNGIVTCVPPVLATYGGGPSTHYFQVTRVLFPLNLAYAMTIHKAQGLTLTCPVLVNCTNWFQCNHIAYVACSRVKNPRDLTIVGDLSPCLKIDPAAMIFDRETVEAETSMTSRNINEK